MAETNVFGICSAIPLIPDKSFVQGKSLIGTGSTGRLHVRRDTFTPNVIPLNLDTKPKLDRLVVRRDPLLGTADGALKGLGSAAQTTVSVVRRDPFSPDVFTGNTKPNLGRLIVRRVTYPLLGTADGALKGLGTQRSAAEKTVSVLRRDPISTDVITRNTEPKLGRLVVRRDPLLGTADGAVKGLGSAAQTTVSVVRRDPFSPDVFTENTKPKLGRLVVRRDPLLGTADGALKGLGSTAQTTLRVVRRDPLAHNAVTDEFRAHRIDVRDLSGEAQANIKSAGLPEGAKKVVDKVTSSSPQVRRRDIKLDRRDTNDNLNLGVKLDRRNVKKVKGNEKALSDFESRPHVMTF
ncbi:hypothetical protein WDU94_015423 [Cyamophila willieti]